MNRIFASAVLIAIAIGMGLLAAATPAAAQVMPAERCYDCPAPRVYDSEETIHTTKDVDQSQVIDTRSEVEVSRRVKETNGRAIKL